MKREFGSALIQDFLAYRDIRLIADTEGACIRGHNMEGTPTVILVGRETSPARSSIRVVLSLGLREQPDMVNPQEGYGPYWRSLVEEIDNPGFANEWIEVCDLPRSSMSRHPWTLSGGGTQGFLHRLAAGSITPMIDLCYRIGIFGITTADDAMLIEPSAILMRGLEIEACRTNVAGESIREFQISSVDSVWYPYDSAKELLPLTNFPKWWRYLWPMRTAMGNRATFGGGTYFRSGRSWYQWHQLPKDEGANPMVISYAEIATHNHFVLDRGAICVYGQSAPIIKLRETASEDDHLRLFGLLNSSTACCWLRIVSKEKGGSAGLAWGRTFQFNSTKLAAFPVPADGPLSTARSLDVMAKRLSQLSPAVVLGQSGPSRDLLQEAETEHARVRSQMIAAQEELVSRAGDSF